MSDDKGTGSYCSVRTVAVSQNQTCLDTDGPDGGKTTNTLTIHLRMAEMMHFIVHVTTNLKIGEKNKNNFWFSESFEFQNSGCVITDQFLGIGHTFSILMQFLKSEL